MLGRLLDGIPTAPNKDGPRLGATRRGLKGWQTAAFVEAIGMVAFGFFVVVGSLQRLFYIIRVVCCIVCK